MMFQNPGCAALMQFNSLRLGEFFGVASGARHGRLRPRLARWHVGAAMKTGQTKATKSRLWKDLALERLFGT
jgi:hypothetical protein